MSEANLMVVTQYSENYGSVEYPYWKSKGGDEYLVSELSYKESIDLGSQGLSKLVDDWCVSHLIDNPMAQEFALDWHLTFAR